MTHIKLEIEAHPQFIVSTIHTNIFLHLQWIETKTVNIIKYLDLFDIIINITGVVYCTLYKICGTRNFIRLLMFFIVFQACHLPGQSVNLQLKKIDYNA